MKTISFDEFRSGISDEELELFVKSAKKRRLIYFLVCLGLMLILGLSMRLLSPDGIFMYIPMLFVGILMGIFSGFGCFANNLVRFVKTQGSKDGGVTSVLWGIWGGILIPIIILAVCRKVNAYRTVLGWDIDKARQQISSLKGNYQDGSDGRLLIDALLDPDNREPITLVAEDGRIISFEQLAVIPYYLDGTKTLFAVLKPIDKVDGIAENDAVVFRAIPQDDGDVKLLAEPNEHIAIEIFDQFKKLINK